MLKLSVSYKGSTFKLVNKQTILREVSGRNPEQMTEALMKEINRRGSDIDGQCSGSPEN